MIGYKAGQRLDCVRSIYGANPTILTTSKEDIMAKEFTLRLPRGVVSWYATSQSASAKTFKITDSTGKVLVETKVFSRDLSNFSVGSFTSSGGDHTVSFPDCRDVKTDKATIVDGNNDSVVVTDQYAGEDSIDGDYNDIFATINWYKKAG